MNYYSWFVSKMMPYTYIQEPLYLFRCEAWNEAANNLRPALARLFVQYAPSVTVTPVRPGMIQEGDKVISKDGFEARVGTVELHQLYIWII